MVKTLCCILLFCTFAVSALALPPPDRTPLSAAAQDSTGTVWAAPAYGQGDEGKVYRWQAKAWAMQSIPEAAGFRALVVTRGDDGCVYVLWQKWDQYQTAVPAQYLVTVSRGTASRLFARLPDLAVPTSPFAPLPALWAGAGGDLWIAADSSRLWHVSASGQAQSFALKPDQLFGPIQPAFSTPFSSLTDSRGRRWFWQSGQVYWEPGRLRGFLIWDGKTLDFHTSLPGLPDRTFTVVIRQDGNHLWVAESKYSFPRVPNFRGGLYQVDMRTLTAVPVTPPMKEGFDTIQEIFRVNGDWWVSEALLFQQAHCRLWRRQGLLWRKEPTALADSERSRVSYNFVGAQVTAPTLETPQGTWLGRGGAGLDWVPRSSALVIPVDWRRGVGAGRVSSLFRMTDGSILAFCGQEGAVVLPPLPPPLFPVRPGVFINKPGQQNTLGDLLTDQRRHLWGLNYTGGLPVLAEWDGRQWHDHSLPKIKSSTQDPSLYACDTQGRLWLTFSVWNPPAQAQPVEGRLVYDPAGNTWTHYQTVPEALAAASRPGMGFLPSRDLADPPQFSREGHVFFMDNNALSFYDGTWRHWKNTDIQPGYPYGNGPDNPRFNQAGHLEINLDSRAFEWTSETGWQLDGDAKRASTAPALPPGGPQGFGGQSIQDNVGGRWIVWNSDVYLTRYGLWRKQDTLSGPGAPFFDGRDLDNVLEDPAGCFFLQTSIPGYTSEYVVWTPPAAAPPPAPRVQIMPLSADSVRLRFEAKMTGPHWFKWRLNGGAWSDPLTTDSVTLTALTPGNYRVEAQAIDTLLQASPLPSAAVFVLQPPTAAQIARWVQALLSGTNEEREAAVAGLVKQPEAALPKLQAARSGASESGRWWVDATLQQITEQAAASESR